MAIQEEMQDLMGRWKDDFSRGNIEGCVEAYLADAAIYSPYSSAAIGRDAIRGLFQEWLAAGETNKRISVLNAASDGTIAYCLIAYSGDYPQEDGSSVTESGVSLNIAEKQTDGSWRLRISSMNSYTPPLAEASQ